MTALFEVVQPAVCSTDSPNFYGLKAGTDVTKNAADVTIDYASGYVTKTFEDQVAQSAECPINHRNLWLVKADGTRDKKADHYYKGGAAFNSGTNVITLKDNN